MSESRLFDLRASRGHYVHEADVLAALAEERKGTFDLATTIDPREISLRPYHSMLLVRRMGNDSLDLYDTDTLDKWFTTTQHHPTHPETREDISCAGNYVTMMQCFSSKPYFAHVRVCDNTLEMRAALVRKWKETSVMSHQHFKAMWAFVTHADFEECGYVYRNLSRKESTELLMRQPEGKYWWLMRRSSADNESIMPNAAVISVAIRDPAFSNSVTHHRLVTVIGAGTYIACGIEPLHSLKAFLNFNGGSIRTGPKYFSIAEFINEQRLCGDALVVPDE